MGSLSLIHLLILLVFLIVVVGGTYLLVRVAVRHGTRSARRDVTPRSEQSRR